MTPFQTSLLNATVTVEEGFGDDKPTGTLVFIQSNPNGGCPLIGVLLKDQQTIAMTHLGAIKVIKMVGPQKHPPSQSG